MIVFVYLINFGMNLSHFLNCCCCCCCCCCCRCCTTHPGAVIHLSDCPTDPSKVNWLHFSASSDRQRHLAPARFNPDRSIDSGVCAAVAVHFVGQPCQRPAPSPASTCICLHCWHHPALPSSPSHPASHPPSWITADSVSQFIKLRHGWRPRPIPRGPVPHSARVC